MRKEKLVLPAGVRETAGQRTGFLLQSAHQKARKALNARLRTLRIETRHLGVLTLLASSPGLRQKELIERLDLDKSSVVLILDDLERLGLAKRCPDPHDRRSHALQITSRGRARLAVAKRIADRLARTIFDGFTRRQRKDLDHALERIIANCNRLHERRAS